MATRIALLHTGDHIDGIPGRFPIGSQVTYDDETLRVYSVEPIGGVKHTDDALSDTAYTAEPDAPEEETHEQVEQQPVQDAAKQEEHVAPIENPKQQSYGG